MAAGRVDFIIEQGEDWTCQLVWSDYYDNPMKVTVPMRMAIKSPFGQIVHELVVPETPPGPDEIAPIAFASESGLIQLHLDAAVTASLQPGSYSYDLFCNVEESEAYAGTQQVKLIFGTVTVRGRVTTSV